MTAYGDVSDANEKIAYRKIAISVFLTLLRRKTGNEPVTWIPDAHQSSRGQWLQRRMRFLRRRACVATIQRFEAITKRAFW